MPRSVAGLRPRGEICVVTSTSTVVFTDIVDSTRLRASLGEEAADRLFLNHDRCLREVVDAHGGRVLKSVGDGVMASFESATDAVGAAVSIQQRTERDFPRLGIRIGAAAGDVSWEDDDCFGLPVVTAARLTARAGGGQILVSSLLRGLAGDRSSASFRSTGPLELKGLPEPVEGFEVE